jgi:hypothetical protein
MSASGPPAAPNPLAKFVCDAEAAHRPLTRTVNSAGRCWSSPAVEEARQSAAAASSPAATHAHMGRSRDATAAVAGYHGRRTGLCPDARAVQTEMIDWSAIR